MKTIIKLNNKYIQYSSMIVAGIIIGVFIVTSIGASSNDETYRARLNNLANYERQEIEKHKKEWQEIDEERIEILKKLYAVDTRRNNAEMQARKSRQEIECLQKLWEFSNKFKVAEPNRDEVCKKEIVKVTKKGGSDHQNEVLQYAFDISKGDTRFVYMLETESGIRNIASNVKQKDGTLEPSFGYCQIHKGFHPQIVNDKNFNNWRWQIDQCHKLYSQGTIFYGILNKELVANAKNNIVIEKIKVN